MRRPDDPAIRWLREQWDGLPSQSIIDGAVVEKPSFQAWLRQAGIRAEITFATPEGERGSERGTVTYPLSLDRITTTITGETDNRTEARITEIVQPRRRPPLDKAA